MNYKFEVYNKVLSITNKVKEFDSKLQELVSTFSSSSRKESDCNLLINKNSITLTINKESEKIPLLVNTRELYQIFYFYIYRCFNQDNQSFVHGAVVSKNGEGVLLLGTFGAGKTTLSFRLQNLGFEINSADHTLLQIIDNDLYAVSGTMRVKYNGNTSYIQPTLAKQKLKINRIMFLIGLSDGGQVVNTFVKDPIYKMKKFWNSIIWVYTNPLQNFSQELLKHITHSQTAFIKKLSQTVTPMYLVRGDSVKVAKQIKKDFEDNYSLKVTAINDEIGDDLTEQIESLKKANLSCLELRKIENKNLDELTDKQIEKVASELKQNKIQVVCLDSPIGKIGYGYNKSQFAKYLDLADKFECQNIRVFSNLNKSKQESEQLLKLMVEIARLRGKELLLENEKGHFYNGEDFDYGKINLLFDDDNCYQDGKNYLKIFNKNQSQIKHIHLRDFDAKTNKFAYIGEGDLNMNKFIKTLYKSKFDGYVSFETHLPMNTDTPQRQKMFLSALEKFNSILSKVTGR